MESSRESSKRKRSFSNDKMHKDYGSSSKSRSRRRNGEDDIDSRNYITLKCDNYTYLSPIPKELKARKSLRKDKKKVNEDEKENCENLETYSHSSPNPKEPAKKSWGDMMDEYDEKQRRNGDWQSKLQQYKDNRNTLMQDRIEQKKSKMLFKDDEKTGPKAALPKESNLIRIQKRQRQIDIGKSTIGYKLYVKDVERYERTKFHPWTPDKYTVCSTRSWEGVMRIWRRKLHFWDPASMKEQPDKFANISSSTSTSDDVDIDIKHINISADIDDGVFSDTFSSHSSESLSQNDKDSLKDDRLYSYADLL